MAQNFGSYAVSRLVDSGSSVVGGRAVKLGSAANTVQVISATTDKPQGVAQNTPAVSLDAASTDKVAIVVSGAATGLAGTAVAAGDSLQVDASGNLVTKSAAGYVVGEALTSAAAGEYFDLVVNIRKEPA